MLLFILPALLAVFIQPALPAVNVSYAYAVDINQEMTASTFNCFKEHGYSAVFIRAYKSQGSGLYDASVPKNIHRAYLTGLGAEVFMTPQPKSTKTGAVQFKEMYDGLKKDKINIKTVWVQVTSPANWGTDSKKNLAFLHDIAKTAISSGIQIGYYTNVHDWNQITKNTPITTPNTPLWYWNTNGAGPSGETPANFNDFRTFGGFKKATVKQFGQSVSVCGVPVNRDVFDTAAKQIFKIARLANGTYIV